MCLSATPQYICCWPWEAPAENAILPLMLSAKQGNSGSLSYCSELINNNPFILLLPPPLFAFIYVLVSFSFVIREKERVLLERGWKQRWGSWRGHSDIWPSSNLLHWLWAPLGKEVRDVVWLCHKTELYWGQSDQVGLRVGEEDLVCTSVLTTPRSSSFSGSWR